LLLDGSLIGPVGAATLPHDAGTATDEKARDGDEPIAGKGASIIGALNSVPT
jgi:hypothetical protein